MSFFIEAAALANRYPEIDLTPEVERYPIVVATDIEGPYLLGNTAYSANG